MAKIFTQSTSGLRPNETFDAWSQSAMPFVDVNNPASDTPFSASRVLAAATLGTFVDTRSEALGIERTAKQVRRHDYDEVGISMVVSGDCYQRQADGSVLVRPGDIAVVDMGRPFAIGATTAYRELRINLPREVFAAQIGRIRALAGRNFSASGPLQGLFASYFREFADVLPTMSATEADRGFEGLLHLLQTALGVHALAAENEAGPLALRSLAETYIRRHLHDPDLDPTRISAALCISRTRLYVAFAETDGVAATILETRLDAARRLLALPGAATIGVVLLDCGFRDAPSFNRAFRRRFGMTPTEFRAMSGSR